MFVNKGTIVVLVIFVSNRNIIHILVSSGSDGKNLPPMQETQVQSLGKVDPLEEGMATHSSILAWRIPWPEELQSIGSQESDMTEQLNNTIIHIPLTLLKYTI